MSDYGWAGRSRLRGGRYAACRSIATNCGDALLKANGKGWLRPRSHLPRADVTTSCTCCETRQPSPPRSAAQAGPALQPPNCGIHVHSRHHRTRTYVLCSAPWRLVVRSSVMFNTACLAPWFMVRHGSGSPTVADSTWFAPHRVGSGCHSPCSTSQLRPPSRAIASGWPTAL
jgi:hypothetical protein